MSVGQKDHEVHDAAGVWPLGRFHGVNFGVSLPYFGSSRAQVLLQVLCLQNSCQTEPCGVLFRLLLEVSRQYVTLVLIG